MPQLFGFLIVPSLHLQVQFSGEWTEFLLSQCLNVKNDCVTLIEMLELYITLSLLERSVMKSLEEKFIDLQVPLMGNMLLCNWSNSAQISV
jgi:hypothetical protein